MVSQQQTHFHDWKNRKGLGNPQFWGSPPLKGRNPYLKGFARASPPQTPFLSLKKTSGFGNPLEEKPTARDKQALPNGCRSIAPKDNHVFSASESWSPLNGSEFGEIGGFLVSLLPFPPFHPSIGHNGAHIQETCFRFWMYPTDSTGRLDDSIRTIPPVSPKHHPQGSETALVKPRKGEIWVCVKLGRAQPTGSGFGMLPVNSACCSVSQRESTF